RRNGDGTNTAGLGNDLGFARGVLGQRVEQLVLDAATLQHAAQLDRFINIGRTDQHRPTALVDVRDFLDHGIPFFFFRTEDYVGRVDADERLIGRDGDDVELVDLPKLVRLGHRGTGHARQLLVKLEKVLQGNGGERLRLFLDLDTVAGMLGLDGLVQAIAPLAADHEPAGELVDDNDAQFARFRVA